MAASLTALSVYRIYVDALYWCQP